MKTTEPSPTLLDHLLDSVSECFTPETAHALVNLRQDKRVRRRMEALGEKASQGLLSAGEAREYQTLIEVGDLIATLQLKARRRLAQGAPPSRTALGTNRRRAVVAAPSNVRRTPQREYE